MVLVVLKDYLRKSSVRKKSGRMLWVNRGGQLNTIELLPRSPCSGMGETKGRIKVRKLIKTA